MLAFRTHLFTGQAHLTRRLLLRAKAPEQRGHEKHEHDKEQDHRCHRRRCDGLLAGLEERELGRVEPADLRPLLVARDRGTLGGNTPSVE